MNIITYIYPAMLLVVFAAIILTIFKSEEDI